MANLDLDAVQAFVTVAELRGFTAAADVLATTQSGISIRIAKLEAFVGKRLLERTPRSVTLTTAGRDFLPDARALLLANDAALARVRATPELTQVRLGLTDHVAIRGLVPLLEKLRLEDPNVNVDVTIGLSQDLRSSFDAGDFDAIIVRRDADKRDGKLLYAEELVWVMSDTCRFRPGDVVPLIQLRAPCGVRALAIRALDEAGLAWREVFSGGGLQAVRAAVEAGLGLACLGRGGLTEGRNGRVKILDSASGLPDLPSQDIVLHNKARGRAGRLIERLAGELGS